MKIEKALIIDEPWISEALAGRKTWEMRKGPVKIRGTIALIKKGSATIVGVADLVGCEPALQSEEAYAAAESKHRIPAERQKKAFADGWRTPWVLKNARRLRKPVTYRHPMGAVIWVNLEDSVGAEIAKQIDQT